MCKSTLDKAMSSKDDDDDVSTIYMVRRVRAL